MPQRAPLLRLLSYATRYRLRIALATTCSVINKLADIAPPVLIGAAVDIAVEREDSFIAAMGIVDVYDQLTALAVATLIVWGLESIFEYFFAVLWRNLAQDLEHDLRLDAYGHVQQLDLGFFEDQSTGGLMAVLNDDVNQLERFLDGGANQILQVLTSCVAISVLFFAAAPTVAWLAMFPIPIILWGSFSFQKRIGPRYAAVREQVGALNASLANNLAGISTIKSFTSEAREVSRISAESERYRRANSDAIRLSSAFTPLIRMAIVVGFIATLIWGGWMTLDDEMAVGTYSVLVFMTQRLLWPLTRLGETFDLYQRAMASTTRILDLLDLVPGIVDGTQQLARSDVRGEVVFDDVRFAYSNGVPVLRGLSITIPAGKTVAVVGSTGAGKTSIVKLLLRFYDPTAGEIRLDGHALPALAKADLRAAIGLVSQDVYLFHGTIRENIAYGMDGEVSDDAVRHAASVAGADGFIQAFPEGYDTVIGERGQKLSGGQRQRLSIARAVLKDPPILVLDEATSAVDNETEAAIQKSLEELGKNRSVLVIAHRLSTVRNAHKIYVVSDGRVAEEGAHDRLLMQQGVYARLWSVQTGGGVVE